MKSLPIVWQRLVDPEGNTCGRCGNTHESVLAAVEALKEILKPLDVAPILETREIDSVSFRVDPSQSNRIWIAGKPIEEWLDAKVSSSCCDTVCEGAHCRTLEIGDRTFEVIPPGMVIKAALIAASKMVDSAKRAGGCACDTGCCTHRHSPF